MADSKLTALTELTVPVLTDILYAVDDPGGVPLSTYLEITNLLALFRVSTPGQIFLSGAGIWPSETNGCAANNKTETTTNKQNFYGLDFDPAAIEYCEATVWMPDDYDGGALTFSFWWKPLAGAAEAEVVIGALQAVAYGDGDTEDAVWGTAVEVTDTVQASGTTKDHFSAVSAAVTPAGTPAAGEALQFRFFRKATDVADTMNTADMRLKGIKVFYGKA